MATNQGTASNLGQGGQEAFRALLHSLVPQTTSQEDVKLTPEAVEKLSEKLKELVGDEAIKEFEHRRNERGELVNEEGLPIIEISEPISHSEETESQPDSVIRDIPLITLASLPSVAREKLRQQRNRILDVLEEEERQENERQELAEREEREELLRKRREEALNEKAGLQKAKELQKKMGKALMRNMKLSAEGTDTPPKEEAVLGNSTDIPATRDEVPRKTVTFVETSKTESTRSEHEWNDVTPARLRSGKQPTLLQAFRADSNPVRLNVVERRPAARSSTPPIPNRPNLSQSIKDSDDESEPEAADPELTSGNDEEDGAQAEEHPDTESEEGDGEVELENEYDLDYAQHQREIALEYYHKRNTIGQDAAKAMMEPTNDEEFENDSAFESSALNAQSKPSVSRFKANRIASAYGASNHADPSTSSTSIEQAALPESSLRTIQRSIRLGKIDDNNQLVGGDHDSDNEVEAEGLQETLELLRKGEVYNLGPSGQYIYSDPQPRSDTTATDSATKGNQPGHTSAVMPSDPVTQQQGSRHGSLPPLTRPKISKFKANRSQSGRLSAISRPETHTSPAPSSHVLHSSPQPQRIPGEPIENMHGNLQTISSAEALHPPQTSTPPSSNLFSPMIIDSPSFGPPGIGQSQANISAQPYTSMIVESPSFPKQSTHKIVYDSATATTTLPPSMIVNSPSFPPATKQSRRPEQPPALVPSRNLSRSSATIPEKPRTLTPPSQAEAHQVMSGTVLERVSLVQRDDEAKSNRSATSTTTSKFKQSRANQS